MRLSLNNLIAFVLVSVVAMTSASMALTRGQMRDASGSIIICNGSGPTSVQVDSDGQPIGPLPICPDCAFGLLDFAAVGVPLVAIPFASRGFTVEFDNSVWLGRTFDPARARGPPVA